MGILDVMNERKKKKKKVWYFLLLLLWQPFFTQNCYLWKCVSAYNKSIRKYLLQYRSNLKLCHHVKFFWTFWVFSDDVPILYAHNDIPFCYCLRCKIWDTHQHIQDLKKVNKFQQGITKCMYGLFMLICWNRAFCYTVCNTINRIAISDE